MKAETGEGRRKVEGRDRRKRKRGRTDKRWMAGKKTPDAKTTDAWKRGITNTYVMMPFVALIIEINY